MHQLLQIHHKLIFASSFSQGLTGTPGVQGAEGKPGPLVHLSDVFHS